MSMNHANYYSVSETAKLLGLTVSGIHLWIKQGKIPSIQYYERGKIFIPKDEVHKLQKRTPTKETADVNE